MIQAKRETYSSLTTPLGKRFRAALEKRKQREKRKGLTFNMRMASEEMGWAFPNGLHAILAGRPGYRGRISLGKVNEWIEKNDK